MKSTLLLLSLILFALPLQAAPMWMVEASLSEKHRDDSTVEWKAKPITVEDRKPAIFQLGGLDLVVTPASKEIGIIEVSMRVTRGEGQNVRLLSRPTVTARIGQGFSVGIDNLTFSVVITLAK